MPFWATISISDEGITPIIVEPEPFNPLRRLNAFLCNETGRESKIKHQNQKSSMNKKKLTKKVNNSISDEGSTPIIVEPEPSNPFRKLNAF